MGLFSFTPNTVIKSSEHNGNWTNFANHGLNFTLKWYIPSNLFVTTLSDYIALPDNASISRVDLIVATAPTGADIIVDLEKSTDGGSSWTTIFTGGTNRPRITAGSKTGNTSTIDLPTLTELTHFLRPKISQVGSTITGADLSIMVRGTYTLD